MTIELILGGARSGKSRFAENRAQILNQHVIFIATAQALDAEMQQRIKHHQLSRPKHWNVIEEPIDLASILQKNDTSHQTIIIDCLTLWLSNLLMSHDDKQLEMQFHALLKILPKLASTVLLVSNETSLGVVPIGQINRQFVDEAGRLHQHIAAIADTVTFCVAGLPMRLKG